jgi:hypothetical protein
MKGCTSLVVVVIALLSFAGLCEGNEDAETNPEEQAEAQVEGQGEEQGEKARTDKLHEILTGLKVKGSSQKAPKHEVILPVPAAGVRGAGVRVGNRFAVLWPGLNISPLTALARNLQRAAGQGGDWQDLRRQLAVFLTTFSEYEDEPLLGALDGILPAGK